MTDDREQEIREYVARVAASQFGMGREVRMLQELLSALDAARRSR